MNEKYQENTDGPKLSGENVRKCKETKNSLSVIEIEENDEKSVFFETSAFD